MVFVFDLDDTICDTDGYSERYIEAFFVKYHYPYKQVATDVRFAEQKFDWDAETALFWYKEFGDDMMAEFPCKPYVLDVINRLHDAGHKIVIATARAKDWHTNPEEVTLKWLKDAKIKYDKIYIGRIDKEKICEEENADVFIDDDLKITENVSRYFDGKKGKRVFLSTTPYNKFKQLPDGVERARDFLDFERMLGLEKVKE